MWSLDGDRRIAVPLARVASTPVDDHEAVRIILDGGNELLLSAAHPLADGRTVGELHDGDSLGSRRVTAAEVVAYPFGQTHDILPASDSGIYFSHGIALGSTLR